MPEEKKKNKKKFKYCKKCKKETPLMICECGHPVWKDK